MPEKDTKLNVVRKKSIKQRTTMETFHNPSKHFSKMILAKTCEMNIYALIFLKTEIVFGRKASQVLQKSKYWCKNNMRIPY